MKFLCTCEDQLIRDQAGNLPYKAHCLPDCFWDDFFEKVEQAVQVDPPGTVERSDELTFAVTNHSAWRFIYQCEKCGRLYVQDKNSTLIEFVPAHPGEAKGLFSENNDRTRCLSSRGHRTMEISQQEKLIIDKLVCNAEKRVRQARWVPIVFLIIAVTCITIVVFGI